MIALHKKGNFNLPFKMSSNPLEVKLSLFETNLIQSRCSFDVILISFSPHSLKIVEFPVEGLIS